MNTMQAKRALMVILGLTAVVVSWLSLGSREPSTCFAGSQKCACPMAPGEKLLIPCSSVVDPQSCGVCSVVDNDGTRDGRSCITLP